MIKKNRNNDIPVKSDRADLVCLMLTNKQDIQSMGPQVT